MPHLLRAALKNPLPASAHGDAFPFRVPAIASLPALDFRAPVTLFVGENGSGKSTLLEGLAAAAELRAIGATDVALDDTLSAQRQLGLALRLSWSRRSRQGFFLRAEDFFGYLKNRARDDARLRREKLEAPGASTVEPATGPGARHIDEYEAARFIERHDARSHGESFMDLFQSQVRPGGLYLLDEPEAPLSPARQLALLSLIVKAASSGSQFVIATHAPILMACPHARIYSFDRVPVGEVTYQDLDAVNLVRAFLNDPERYLRQL